MTGARVLERVELAFQAMHAQGLPGAIIGLDWPDGRYVRAFGTADLSTKSPMLPETRSRIGSVSKLLVAHVTLRLADAGLLRIDAPIADYVDGVPNGQVIRLHHLGRHQSGIREPLENHAFRSRLEETPGEAIPVDDTLAAAFALPKAAEPGTSTVYSNANALLLAKACESVTGKGFPELANTYLATPLGIAPWQYAEPVGPRGYRYAGADSVITYGARFIDTTHVDSSWSGAAGAFSASVSDLLDLAPMLLSGEGLRSVAHTQMQDFGTPDIWGTSFGFLLARYESMIGHAGDIHGYAAFLGHDGSCRCTVAVLANLANLPDKTNPAQRFAFDIAHATSR